MGKALSTVIIIVGLLGMTNAGIIDWNAVFKFVGNSASYILSGAEVKQQGYQAPNTDRPIAPSTRTVSQ